MMDIYGSPCWYTKAVSLAEMKQLFPVPTMDSATKAPPKGKGKPAIAIVIAPVRAKPPKKGK